MKKIELAAGILEQKLEIEDDNILLCGQSMESSVLRWHDGGYERFEDGTKRGTFRSYTCYLYGKNAELRDLTIENTAGDGRLVGQSVALYADCEQLLCERVHLISHQDTLFIAPLPDTEREPGGFRGPGENRPRKMTNQVYRDCIIEGDIDFIYGGGRAIFEHCTIVSRYRENIGQERVTAHGVGIQGFITAPCTPEGKPGFLFRDCTFTTDGCPDGSVYLGRPWRPYGEAVFENCTFGSHICPEHFAGWEDPLHLEETARFEIRKQ